MIGKCWLQMYAVERLMSYIVGLMTYTVFMAVLGLLAAREVASGKVERAASEMLAQVIFDGAPKIPGRASVVHALRAQLDALQSVERYRFVASRPSDAALAPQGVEPPLFVAIAVKPHTLSPKALQNVLRKVHPSVDVRGVSKDKQGTRSIRILELICLGILLLTFFGAITAIALSSQTGLVVNRRIISTMALMGATPLYVVRQFQRHTLRIGGQGALIGLGAMLVTFIMLYFMAVHYGMRLEMFCSLPTICACCVGIPAFIVFFMVVATDISVRKYLKVTVDSVDEWSI